MNQVDIFRQWLLTRESQYLDQCWPWLSKKIVQGIHGVARQLPSCDVNDIQSDVFMRLLSVPYRYDKKPLGWLGQVTRRVTMEFLKKRQNRLVVSWSEEFDDDHPIEMLCIPQDEDFIVREHYKTKLSKVAHKIPRMTYRCLRMKTRGHAYSKIASRCGITHRQARIAVGSGEKHLARLAVA